MAPVPGPHVDRLPFPLQRAHQKLVEIAPSPTLTVQTRDRLTAASVSMAREVGYGSLGTFEFLVDADDDARFAFIEAGLAQFVYLVGFSLAHFWEGFTGLTVTVLAILTLFLLMQWTGRVRWSEALRARKPAPAQVTV